MRRLTFGGLTLLAALAIAACGGGASPPTASQAASQPASQPAASTPADSGGGAAACEPSTAAGTVEATIEGQAFSQPLTAKVGDVVTWTNKDAVPHSVVLDDGSCQTDQLSQNATASLAFSAAGDYAFHCGVHPSMTATITVTE
jgi:plastocyanin